MIQPAMTTPTDNTRHVLQSLMAGNAPNGVAPTECGDYEIIVTASYDAFHSGGFKAAQRYISSVARTNKAVMSLLSSDTPILIPDAPAYPALPMNIDYSKGADTGAWLSTYVDYANQRSPMTPAIFHESAGLWLMSVAIARRLRVKMSFDDIYPNLFVVWIATTTLWHKTTALNVARGLADRAFPHLLTPQDATPEALIADMAGREPSNKDQMDDVELARWKAERDYAGQRGWMLDEISSLINGGAKEYNAGLLETFLRFFDCDPRYTRSTKTGGRVTIRNAYLSVIGASTPAVMSQHMSTDRMWSMGWWPRFAILTPEQDRPPYIRTPDYVVESPDLLRELHKVYSRLPAAVFPDIPEARNVPLGKQVLATWEQYNKAMSYDLLTDDLDTRLWGCYGRMPVQVLKIATLLATMDWSHGDVPAIDMAHLTRAIEIAERWRASAHRALNNSSTDELGAVRQRVIRQITRHEPNGISLRDLHRAMKDVDLTKLEMSVQECVKLGDVEEVASQAGQRGRPTVRYRCPR